LWPFQSAKFAGILSVIYNGTVRSAGEAYQETLKIFTLEKVKINLASLIIVRRNKRESKHEY